MPFDPDRYLAEKSISTEGFNPDAYLQSKIPAEDTNKAKIERALDRVKDIGTQPILSIPERQALANMLPTAGGIVGGVVGTPADIVAGPMGTVAGAGVGAGLGTAMRDYINRKINPQEAPQSVTQALINPIVEGGKAALLQGTGEAVAPYIAKGVSMASKPISDLLAKFAAKQAVKATGVPGSTVFNKFPEAAGQELLDRGIVGFGDTQAQIAEKAVAQQQAAGKEIGKSLSALDEGGTNISKQQLLKEFDKRIAAMEGSPAEADSLEQLKKIRNNVDAGPESYSLTKSEEQKRLFANKSNYDNPASDKARKEAADIFRQGTEDIATRANPELAGQFQQAKSSYGLLNPIAEATAKKTAQAAQQGINISNLGRQGLGTLIGGEEGYRHGGLPGLLAGATAGAVIGPRITSSTAATSNLLSQVSKNIPSLLAKSAPAVSQAISAKEPESNPVESVSNLSSWPQEKIQSLSNALKSEDNPAHQRLGVMLDGTASGNQDKRAAMLFAISQNKDYRDIINSMSPDLISKEKQNE